ncbi:MAG: succinate dehydrogenase, cytochrome b556 subunit [Rhodobacter sp.]|nr:succinate dehydrogenase, cytochrome b556 subunit [Rhodobacter sp.]
MRKPLWYAYLLHRVSGLLLVLFLPVHFWILALAMRDADRLDAFLALADRPMVKAAEFGLVFLLAAHLFGGLRVLALEFLSWTASQKTLAAGSVAVSFALAALFLLRAI